MYNRLHRMPACDGRTDRRTDRQKSCHGIVRAMHTRRAVKNDNTVIIDSHPACGWPRAVHPSAEINKVKDLALIIAIIVFSMSSFNLLSNTHLKQSFGLTHGVYYWWWTSVCSSSLANTVAVSASLLTSFLYRC